MPAAARPLFCHQPSPVSLCQDISLTPAVPVVLLHAEVGRAEDTLEKGLDW